MKPSALFFALIAFLVSPFAAASDWQREVRMADEIVDAILDGEVEMLVSDGREFLSIYTEAESSSKAAIIIHGRGFHPDWVDTVQPLRIGLVEHGWNTLSIQMPVLAKDARYYDYVPVFDEAIPRIQAAIDYLRSAGNTQIALIAHSCGVHMTMHYLRKHGDDGLAAYVGIGMGATDYKQPMREEFPLASLAVPVLDIYAADDYPAVHRLAPGRWQQIQQADHPKSKQMVIADANHYFTDRGDVLVEAVGTWLDNLGLDAPTIQ